MHRIETDMGNRKLKTVLNFDNWVRKEKVGSEDTVNKQSNDNVDIC